MQIFLAADHNGLELKNKLVAWLTERGEVVHDLGPTALDPDDDYPDYGIKVARAVAEQPGERVGILVCGSGVGMAVVADKVKGVRAGLIHEPTIAKAARRDDDINVLALGARYISDDAAKAVVTAWLAARFTGEVRHKRRIAKIERLESEHAH